METPEQIARIAPWNMVVQARTGHGADLHELLCDLGRVQATAQPDVFFLFTDDPVEALERLQLWRRFNPLIGEALERVVPLVDVFDYGTSAELERRACASVCGWRGRFAGQCVYLRREDQAASAADGDGDVLGEILRRLIAGVGTVATQTCRDPDVILSFACNDHWAGISVWPRTLRSRYPELGFDGDEPAAA